MRVRIAKRRLPLHSEKAIYSRQETVTGCFTSVEEMPIKD